MFINMACDSVTNIPSSEYLYNYLTKNVNSICRICLEKNSTLMKIFDPVKPPHFSLLIMACATVQVSMDDGLPPNICKNCLARLNVAFQFKTQCENADQKLRQILTNAQLQKSNTDEFVIYNDIKEDPEHEKEQLFAFNESVENPVLNTYNQQDATNLDNGIVNMNENLGLNVNNDNEASYILNLNNDEFNHHSSDYSLNGNEKSELQQLQNIPLDSSLIKLEFEECKATNKQNTNTETIENINTNQKTKSSKEHKCHICTKVFHTKNSLVHHIRIHTGERPYVCHICHKRFINGGHLHTHMRTHTGEKNHICAACPKAFATAQQLTKHTIAIHTTERPYSCPYCVKRFANSSNLSTHIKVHTGEKNYYCDQCGKAFSTKGQLDQHMLVHTGEKPFLCESCDKRFSQKAHLVRHSKLHQQISK